MATNFLYGAAGTGINLLTTELNSLATGSGSAAGPAIDNTSNKYQVGRLELKIASNSLAFTAASFVKVFFIPRMSDGTNYPTYTSGASYKLAEGNYLAGIININPATQSSNVVYEILDYVNIPQGFYKSILVSAAGVTLPSSGNTLDLIPTPSQY